MARPVVRRATGVVGCRTGVAYTPIPLEMMCFPWGDIICVWPNSYAPHS